MKSKEQLYQEALELTKCIMANPSAIDNGLDILSVLTESYNALNEFNKYVDNYKEKPDDNDDKLDF